MSTLAPVPLQAASLMVAPLFLVPLLSEAGRLGVAPELLFRGLEIEAVDLEAPGTVISHQDAVTVVRRALRCLPIADAGLALGQRATITERGTLALGLLASATLGDAIRLALRFAQSAGYLMAVREDFSAEEHHLVAEPLPGDQDLQRFLVEFTFSAIVQLRRQITFSDYVPLSVQFVHPPPAHAASYAAVFGCPVRFGCLSNAMITRRDALTLRLPWANALSCRLSSNLLERESARFRSMSAVAFAVERAIRRLLPETADLAQVANSLNLSERTLRRQLAQEGLSYRQLLDESRRSRAFDLMTNGHRPLADIAAAVGFSDPRAFTRAFKRWTGQPPSLIKHGLPGGREEPDRLLDRDSTLSPQASAG